MNRHVKAAALPAYGGFRVSALRAASGTFCTLIGALMLIAPHQFNAPAYASLYPYLPLWGTLFLLSGGGLIGAATLAPRRSRVVAAHLAVGAMFLALAWALFTSEVLSGTVVYSLLGIGTLLAPWLESPPTQETAFDLFAVLMGLISAALGLLILGVPAQFDSPLYDTVRPALPLYGAALLTAGTALLFVSCRPVPRWARLAAHTVFGLTFWVWLLATFGFARVWTAHLLYGGFGLAVVVRPLLGARLGRFDPASLRTRLVVALVALVAAALTVTTTFVTEYEEKRATAQALAAQRTLAVTFAQEVATYVGLHEAAVAALAARPDLFSLPQREQARVLSEVGAAYPDMVTFNLYSPGGAGLARSDRRLLITLEREAFFRNVSKTGARVLDIGLSPTFERPRFNFLYPVREEGRPVGVVTGILESQKLTDLLEQVKTDEAMTVYLVDDTGRVIAHPDEALVARAADLSDAPPVAAYLRQAASGALSYAPDDPEALSGTLLASYATVPEYGWGVIAERPRLVALAPTRAGRDLTFILLLAGIVGAALLGALLARGLTAPLKTLARLTEQIARGEHAPLPESRITEVAHLAAVFGTMRERLDAAHTKLEAQVAELQATEDELRRANAQLYQGAFYDALTELPNRTLFMDRLEQALKQQTRHPERSAAVLFLDFDRFKLVNDSLGHEAGDVLLKGIAQRLATCVRPTDTVARLGGDEFTILIEEVSGVRQVMRVAERIRAAFVTPLHVQGHELFTSASVGIVASTGPYRHANEVVRDADIAMYRAKAKGGASAEIFSRNMHEEVIATIQLEKELRQALQEGQFRVAYQPIFAADEQLVGFEALLRWQHPERGLLGPGAFLDVAEETGLIVEIDRLVWREACTQVRRWQEESGKPLSLNLNLSSQQFYRPDLLDVLGSILDETAIAPSRVNLEITEGALIDASPGTMNLLEALKDLGFCLYLDDFGTGYSSLSYLQHFPIDVLKIDRSFVMQLNKDASSAELVRTIVAMARNLRLRVVAEGVETTSQLQVLHDLGCQQTQGFLFAEPLFPEGASRFLAA